MADEEREMQFDKLMEAYQNDILRLCYGMLNNMTDAEDALQDTFVKVWKSMHRYQGKNSSSVYTWIYRIAINTCKDYLRLRYFKRKKDTVTDDSIANDENYADASFQYYELWMDIARLPEKNKVVLLLYHYHHMSITNIARILRISQPAVSKRLHKAYMLLKEGNA